MLEIRPSCENCDKPLPNGSPDAMICTFECAFCVDCVTNILDNVCPNCGGDFVRRPTRPKLSITRHPASTEKKYKPIDMHAYQQLHDKFINVDPRER